MDTLTAIFTRRSVRRYILKPIPDADVQTILKAGMQAPSAHNERPWHFVVLTDRQILAEIPTFHDSALMLPDAAVAILICGEPARQVRPGRWMQDCAAATENMLLAAHAIGYGAVWLGIYPQEGRVNGIRRLIGLPLEIEPFSIVSIGYPVDTIPAIDRFDPARVRQNHW